MKVNNLKINSGSRGDKSVIWTLSDTYVNWCQIVVGNPEYLQKLYSGAGLKLSKDATQRDDGYTGKQQTDGTSKKACPCSNTQTEGADSMVPAISTKGPCTMDELEQWQRLIDLVELKKKCAELQRRLQNETFYKCRMAVSQDCKKQVFECPCVPRKDAYVKGKPAIKGGRDGDKKNKGGDSKGGKNKNKKDNGKGKSGGGKNAGADVRSNRRSTKKAYGLNSSENCIEYKLSTDDRKGSGEIGTKKIFTFQTEPLCFEGNYFRPRTCGEKYLYPDGTVVGKFDCDGTGTMYYPNGEAAITVTKGKLGCRLTVMSKSGHNESGEYMKTSPIALFDSKGNGVVYDQHGKIRLNYDQAEGILYDTPSGVPARWQWQLHSFVKKRREQLQGVQENEPDDEPESDVQVAKLSMRHSQSGKKRGESLAKQRTSKKSKLEQISTIQKHSSITQTSVLKTEDRTGKELDLEDWAALVEKSVVAIEPKPLVVKMNQYVALRILKQDHIHLDFRPFPLHFRVNLGVKVLPHLIERIDKVTEVQGQVSAVPCYFELLHRRTKSLRNLHSNLETVRKDNIADDKIRFIKKAKLMGILKYITQMAMKKLNQDEERLTKMMYRCQ